MRNLCSSTCFVIPPHVLRNVADRAPDDDLRKSAAATLDTMQAIAIERQLVAPPPPARDISKRRNVYDARHRQTLPGTLVLAEGGKRRADVEVNEAYEGAGATYDFFLQVLGRRSIDGRGMRLDSTVHYGRRFDNAMWNGSQMIYGDGDGKVFNRFTAALDVIGHELTHGVTQRTSALAYTGQSGALNEHLSDAFGIMVKQYTQNQTVTQSDWLIGEGLLGASVHGRAVRSMAAPGTAYDDPLLGRDPQPAHMRDYWRGWDDNGGVHINSGIPNHAFYLAATAIGGYAWEALGHVWYEVLTASQLNPHAQFDEFAEATVARAGSMFGAAGRVQRAVRNAWLAVGVLPHQSQPQRQIERRTEDVYEHSRFRIDRPVDPNTEAWP